MIPTGIDDAVRRAAAAVPGSAPDMTLIRRRRLRHQARTTSVTAVAVVGVLAAGAIVAPRLLTGTPDAAVPPAPDAAPPAAPAQQLIVATVGSIRSTDGASIGEVDPDPSAPNFGYRDGVVGLLAAGPSIVAGSGEVRPIVYSVSGPEIRGVLPLADGGFITLEEREPTLEPCPPGYQLFLRAYDASGIQLLSHDLAVQCESVILVGATSTEAYLVRVPLGNPLVGGRLVVHSLATGAEQPLVSLDGFSDNILGQRLDLSTDASRLAAVSTGAACRGELLDVATGAVAPIDLASLLSCYSVLDSRLSPNGDRLAVVYETPGTYGTGTDLVLAVVDLASGTVSLQEIVATGTDQAAGATPLPTDTLAAGLAWTDDTTLRAAFVVVPPEASQRVVLARDHLDVRTYTL